MYSGLMPYGIDSTSNLMAIIAGVCSIAMIAGLGLLTRPYLGPVFTMLRERSEKRRRYQAARAIRWRRMMRDAFNRRR